MPVSIRRHWPVKAGIIAVDLLSISTAFFTAYYLRFWSDLFTTFRYVPIDYYLFAWPAVSIVFISCMSFFGLYDNRKPYSPIAIFLDCF